MIASDQMHRQTIDDVAASGRDHAHICPCSVRMMK